MDEMDRNELRERKVRVHIAADYALRFPEQKQFRQRCVKCGRSLRTWEQERLMLFQLRSDEVDRYGVPAGTFIAITRDAQYITGPRLGINEEFCS